MSESKDELKDCIDLFDVLTVCIGDKVELVVRGQRAIISYRGVVKAISNTAILLEVRGALIAIRLSEIKTARKLPQK